MKGIHCAAISGTRTARARRTKAADGFPVPMDYFEVTETQGPLRVVRGEFKSGRLIMGIHLAYIKIFCIAAKSSLEEKSQIYFIFQKVLSDSI